jgi:hypothetical protein
MPPANQLALMGVIALIETHDFGGEKTHAQKNNAFIFRYITF